jgi:hypothetical protein
MGKLYHPTMDHRPSTIDHRPSPIILPDPLFLVEKRELNLSIVDRRWSVFPSFIVHGPSSDLSMVDGRSSMVGLSRWSIVAGRFFPSSIVHGRD